MLTKELKEIITRLYEPFAQVTFVAVRRVIPLLNGEVD
jgi:hypothetical protein